MAAIDLFPSIPTGNAQNPAVGLDAPATLFEAVTPSDSVDLTYVSRAVYVGGAGNIAALDMFGNAVMFIGCVAGSILPVRLSRILIHEVGSPVATGTTATNLVAMT